MNHQRHLAIVGLVLALMVGCSGSQDTDRSRPDVQSSIRQHAHQLAGEASQLADQAEQESDCVKSNELYEQANEVIREHNALATPAGLVPLIEYPTLPCL
jgi:hypothetical protein